MFFKSFKYENLNEVRNVLQRRKGFYMKLLQVPTGTAGDTRKKIIFQCKEISSSKLYTGRISFTTPSKANKIGTLEIGYLLLFLIFSCYCH